MTIILTPAFLIIKWKIYKIFNYSIELRKKKININFKIFLENVTISLNKPMTLHKIKFGKSCFNINYLK